MLKELSPLHLTLSANTGFTVTLLKDVEESAFVKPLEDFGNSAQFIAGHLVVSRFELGKMIGLKEPTPWGGKFDSGSKPKEPEQLPGRDEILEVWNDISKKLLAKMEELTESDIRPKAPFAFPVSDQSILGGIAFMTFHDSYHIGQLGYLRRFMGQKPAFG